ncbi:MAG: nitrophenyl compound nitroreductase subunit ArsF family protein [Bacteroidales bacterium]
MKTTVLLATLLLLIFTFISCSSQSNKKVVAQKVESSNVNVYYFHFTRRCATCLAVEDNARKAVEALFPNEVKAGDYSFTAINLDEASSKEIANKLSVGGQTLLVVRGDKKIDITDKGFLNAHDLEKMKVEIKSAVDKVLF